MVDARLKDGSRVNAIIPPLALDGPILSIRKFGVNKVTINDLKKLETLTERMVQREDYYGIGLKWMLNVEQTGGREAVYELLKVDAPEAGSHA